MEKLSAPPYNSSIDAVAAQRLLTLKFDGAPWLHEEVGKRMAQRLPAIQLPVHRWVDASIWRGGQGAAALVASHYPRAKAFVLGPQAIVPSQGSKARLLWPFGRGGIGLNNAQNLQGSMQMIWANMCAHLTAQPSKMLSSWHQALEEGGFLMFSTFGPGTLAQLRNLYAELGWQDPAQEFTDMQQWGDWLAQAGFENPVMDCDRLTLTFSSAQSLLAELRDLGRNLNPKRFAALRTRAWRDELLAQMDQQLRQGDTGCLALSFEIIYGHALAAKTGRAALGQNTISLDELKAALDRSRKPTV